MMLKKLLKTLEKEYRIKELKVVKKVTGGYLSDNYKLKDKQQEYFLKKYREFSAADMKSIHAVKKFFSDGRIPVIAPLTARKKQTYILFEGRYYALFPFVHGQVFTPPVTINPSALRSGARMLARMHLLSKRGVPRGFTQRLGDWKMKRIVQSEKDFETTAARILTIINAKKKLSVYDRFARKTIGFKMTTSRKLPTYFNVAVLGHPHVAHGDFHFENAFFDKKGEMIHVFDFEKSEIRPRILEILRSMFIVCFQGSFTNTHFKAAEQYIKAYNKLYPIKTSELKAGLEAILYKHVRTLWIEKEHYLKNSKKFDVFLRENYNTIYYLVHNMESLNKRIKSWL